MKTPPVYTWVRFHRAPRVVRDEMLRGETDELSARASWKLEQSKRRYALTEDGKRTADMAPRVLAAGEVGVLERFRIITNPHIRSE